MRFGDPPSGPVQHNPSCYPARFAPVARAQNTSLRTAQADASRYAASAAETPPIREQSSLRMSLKKLTDLPEEARLHFKTIVTVFQVYAGKQTDPWRIPPEDINHLLPAVYSKVVGSPGQMSPFQWRIARNIVRSVIHHYIGSCNEQTCR
jgi:hypothetical protein